VRIVVLSNLAGLAAAMVAAISVRIFDVESFPGGWICCFAFMALRSFVREKME